MFLIQPSIEAVQQRMAQACLQAHRATGDVTLLAVTKTVPVARIQEAIHAGLRQFGENYISEAVEKIAYFKSDSLASASLPLVWHCIGPVQSNKTRLVATHFDWVQTLDRLKIAQRLSEQRPAHLAPLQVCIQVNMNGDPTKSGVAPDELQALAQSIAQLPNLKLRGLMTIPDIPSTMMANNHAIDSIAIQAIHAKAKALFSMLNHHGFELDTLSIGMSADLAPAIQAGSTMVRVGSAIFGQRR